jgi:hypothetical protein
MGYDQRQLPPAAMGDGATPRASSPRVDAVAQVGDLDTLDDRGRSLQLDRSALQLSVG